MDDTQKKLQEEAVKEQLRNEAERRIIAWDNQMQRAFKGIFTRKQRHDLMVRAMVRGDV